MDLLKKHCIPCEGGEKPFTAKQIAEYFQALEDWYVVEDTELVKQYKCKDFLEVLAFVNAIGAIAETEGHHPDINLFGWNKVKLTLSTHTIGGLSINDFILAAKIDAMRKQQFPTVSVFPVTQS